MSGGGAAIQKSLLNNTAWNTAGTTVYFITQWLITLIVVWLYGDFAEAGTLALAVSISSFFQCIATYNLRAFQVSDVKGEYSDSTYIAARFVTCIAAALLCLVFALISGYAIETVYVVMAYMGYRIVESLIDVLHGVDHKHWRLDYVGISMIARGLLTLAAFTILGRMFDLLSAVLGMIAVTVLLGLLYDLPKARKLIQFVPYTLKQIASLLKRGFPLMLMALIFLLFTSYTRYTVERIHGAEALGSYSTAVTPAVALQFVISFLFAPLISVFSECIKNSDKAKFIKIFARVCITIAVLTVAAIAVAYFAGPWGLELLVGAIIRPYTYLLPSAVLVMGISAALWYFSIIFTTTRDLKGILYPSLAGAAVCLAGTGFFVTHFGLIGANYSQIACQGVVLLLACIRLFYNFKRRPI